MKENHDFSSEKKIMEIITIGLYDMIKELDFNILQEDIKNKLSEYYTLNFIHYDENNLYLNDEKKQSYNLENGDKIIDENFSKNYFDLKNKNYIIFDFAHIFNSNEITTYNIIPLGYESINKKYLLKDSFRLDEQNKIIPYHKAIYNNLTDFDPKERIPSSYFIYGNQPDAFFEKYCKDDINLDKDDIGKLILNILYFLDEMSITINFSTTFKLIIFAYTKLLEKKV